MRKLSSRLETFIQSSTQLLIMSHFLDEILKREFGPVSKPSPKLLWPSVEIGGQTTNESVDWGSGQLVLERLLEGSGREGGSTAELVENFLFLQHLCGQGSESARVTEVIGEEQLLSMSTIFGLKEKLKWAQNLRAVDVLVSTSIWDLISNVKFEARFTGAISEKSVSDVHPTPSFNKPANVFQNSMAQDTEPREVGERLSSVRDQRETLRNRLDKDAEQHSLSTLEFFSFNLLVKHLFGFDIDGMLLVL